MEKNGHVEPVPIDKASCMSEGAYFPSLMEELPGNQEKLRLQAQTRRESVAALKKLGTVRNRLAVFESKTGELSRYSFL